MKTTRILTITACWMNMGLAAFSQGIIIPGGIYVIANNGNIVTSANWVNNGSFTHNGGTVVFSGTNQTLGGSSATLFNNLTVSAGSNTTIVSPGQQVIGVVTSNDTLNANGNLTLLSTASQTALISGAGAGEVTGNLTMQRYLASGFGYKYFSSPFRSDTVGDFAREINLGASFPDVYSFNENLSSAGWVNYTTSSGLLTPLAGYAVNFGSSSAAMTVNMTGVVNNHTQSVALYNHNNTYTQGFNLVGNPYPSPIDWNSSTGWTKTNIDNALYFFSAGTTNQYTGTYSSYINGVSSNGVASNIIGAMQGFFVHVSNGSYPVSGLLSINNNARNTNPSVIFFGIQGPSDQVPLVRLSAGFEDQDSVTDAMVCYFKEGATTDFNRKMDALKLMNTYTGVPNLYTVAADTARMSIRALPYPIVDSTVVAINLETAIDGRVTFRARDLVQLPDGLHVYLSDRKTGAIQDLRQEAIYRLFLPAGMYKDRFNLVFTYQQLSGPANGAVDMLEAYDADGTIMVRSLLPSGQRGDLTIVSLSGQLLYRSELTDNNYHPVPLNAAAGIYIVALRAGHEVYAKKVFSGGHP